MPGDLLIGISDDVEALVEPHREAMLVAYRGFFETPFPSDEMLRNEWRELLAEPDATIFAAEIGGRPAGTVAARVVGDEGWLEKLYVHPDFQGDGVGRALHDRALALLQARGCRRANLWVLEVNQAAIEVYQRWGWTRADDPPSAPWGLPQARFTRPI